VGGVLAAAAGAFEHGADGWGEAAQHGQEWVAVAGGGGDALANMQPFAAINFINKT